MTSRSDAVHQRIKFAYTSNTSGTRSRTTRYTARNAYGSVSVCSTCSALPDVHWLIRAQGPNLGKDGIDTTPSDARAAPVAPPQFQFDAEHNPENVSAKKTLEQSVSQDTMEERGEKAGKEKAEGAKALEAEKEAESRARKLLPRETGHDIGMGSPVPLSAEAVSVITNLRNMKVSSLLLP